MGKGRGFRPAPSGDLLQWPNVLSCIFICWNSHCLPPHLYKHCYQGLYTGGTFFAESAVALTNALAHGRRPMTHLSARFSPLASKHRCVVSHLVRTLGSSHRIFAIREQASPCSHRTLCHLPAVCRPRVRGKTPHDFRVMP
jgi:hypothetical protein